MHIWIYRTHFEVSLFNRCRNKKKLCKKLRVRVYVSYIHTYTYIYRYVCVYTCIYMCVWGGGSDLELFVCVYI